MGGYTPKCLRTPCPRRPRSCCPRHRRLSSTTVVTAVVRRHCRSLLQVFILYDMIIASSYCTMCISYCIMYYIMLYYIIMLASQQRRGGKVASRGTCKDSETRMKDPEARPGPAIHVCIYIYIYIYIRIHIYIYIYIYIYYYYCYYMYDILLVVGTCKKL